MLKQPTFLRLEGSAEVEAQGAGSFRQALDQGSGLQERGIRCSGSLLINLEGFNRTDL